MHYLGKFIPYEISNNFFRYLASVKDIVVTCVHSHPKMNVHMDAHMLCVSRVITSCTISDTRMYHTTPEMRAKFSRWLDRMDRSNFWAARGQQRRTRDFVTKNPGDCNDERRIVRCARFGCCSENEHGTLTERRVYFQSNRRTSFVSLPSSSPMQRRRTCVRS